MEISIKRFRARIVATLDLTFSIITFIVTTGIIAFQGYLYLTVQDNHQSYDKSGDFRTEKAFIGNMTSAKLFFINLEWFFIVTCLIYSSISLCAAMALFRATKLEAKPYQALRNALIWRNTVVVFMVFRVMVIIVGGMFGIVMAASIVVAIINGICLWIVFEFIAELENAAKLPATQRKTENNA